MPRRCDRMARWQWHRRKLHIPSRRRRPRGQQMCPRSLRKALFVVEKFGVVNIRTFEDFGATFTDGHEGRARGVALAAAANGFEAFADSLDYGGSHGLASFAGELLRKLVCFGVFDIEAHASTLTDECLPFYSTCGELKMQDRKSV